MARVPITRALVFAGWMGCCLAANVAPCSECDIRDVELHDGEQRRIRARLYLPPLTNAATQRPATGAVVVLPGYFANLEVMQHAWIPDLVRLGIPILAMDRFGQAGSWGRLWPARQPRTDSEIIPSDVLAGVAFLRRVPFVDPDRIAVVGHSAGGTAAIAAGVYDWTIAATGAVSASSAPIARVNHLAPANLLLIYGTDDRFVVANTDVALIRRATRGVLSSVGAYGDVGERSGRKLVEISGAGHADVLMHPAVVRELGLWLEASVSTGDWDTRLAKDRTPAWITGTAVVVGVLLLALFGRSLGRASLFDARPAATDPTSHGHRPLARFNAPLGWIAGLASTPFLAERLGPWAPAQEGGAYFAFLLGPSLGVATFLAGADGIRDRVERRSMLPTIRRWVLDFSWGIAIGAVLAVALRLLFLGIFGAELTRERGQLLLFLFPFAAAAGGAYFRCLAPSEEDSANHGWTRPGIALVLVAATSVTAILAFERMAVVPGLLIGAVLAFLALRIVAMGHPTPAHGAGMAAALLSWVGAMALPLHE